MLQLKEALRAAESRAEMAETARREAETELDSHLCVVCMETNSNTAIEPCMHVCLCAACAEDHEIPDCPRCRVEVQGIRRVFL